MRRRARSEGTRELKVIASTRISAIFANSDGSTWKPPGSENQARAPFTDEPSGVSTATRASRVAA